MFSKSKKNLTKTQEKAKSIRKSKNLIQRHLKGIYSHPE